MTKAFAVICLIVSIASAQAVKVERRDAAKRVDITVDGKAFTSFRWDDRIMRPVLYPIFSSGGSFVTRGFPFETRDADTIDHPHQVGCSLSYGNVNGIDFWNSSTFRAAEEMKRMGRIQHLAIVSARGGKRQAELITTAAWIKPDGSTTLSERTRYSFNAAATRRWIDRETTLTALEDVTFGDSKEGMFAIHLPSELEQSDQTKVKVTTRDGVISVRGERSDILSGVYSSIDGLVGESKVWGTIGKWAMVSGHIGSEKITVAIFDHPSNTNFPSRLMVRGYGLLALNPIGQKQFDPKLEERTLTLTRGDSITFRYRLLIVSGENLEVEKEYKSFAK